MLFKGIHPCYLVRFAVLSLSLVIGVRTSQLTPSSLSLENLPNTSFTCSGKAVGGYYADIDTNCQMFHVCTMGQRDEIKDIRFLCLQGTVFDQVTKVCERQGEVRCGESESHYDVDKITTDVGQSIDQTANDQKSYLDTPSAAKYTSKSKHTQLQASDCVTCKPAQLSKTLLAVHTQQHQPTYDKWQAAVEDQVYGQVKRSRTHVPLSIGRRSRLYSPVESLSETDPGVSAYSKEQPFRRFRDTRRLRFKPYDRHNYYDGYMQRSSSDSPSSDTNSGLDAEVTAGVASSQSHSSHSSESSRSHSVPRVPYFHARDTPDTEYTPDIHSASSTAGHVIVTNGRPFVPQLQSIHTAPSKQNWDDYNYLPFPDTNFTCKDKVSGGHYADPETDCRMFHICVRGQNDTIIDYKLWCGNSTAFEQVTRTCQEQRHVDCKSSADSYSVNDHLIVPEWVAPSDQSVEEKIVQSSNYDTDAESSVDTHYDIQKIATKKAVTTSKHYSTDDGDDDQEYPVYYADYVEYYDYPVYDEYEYGKSVPATSTTPAPRRSSISSLQSRSLFTNPRRSKSSLSSALSRLKSF